MKKILQLFICVFPVSCFAQNLLVNGGFEAENICTEYTINCAPEAWVSSIDGFANYYKDENRAYKGTHCMALQVGHARKPYTRTYLRSRLLCGLRKGSQYRLELYVKSRHPILDSIGVYFGVIDPLFERKPVHLLAPSLRFIDQGNQFVRDSSWQKVRLDYTATGDETFITIANFSIKDITGPTGISKENNFFVYLDEVSLLPLNPDEKLCADWQQTRENIYAEDARHEFLSRLYQYRRANPVESVRPTPITIFKADTLLLPDLLFATGKKDLKPASLSVLDSFCARMGGGKVIDSLIIEGHADNTGTVEINEALAAGRAEATAGYLAQCGPFYRKPVLIRGWGSRKPVTGNDTPQGRQQNRRVELRIYFRE